VLISHDHYDHLDEPTIKRLIAVPNPPKFFVPLGVGAHLDYWGVSKDNIVELDWWERSRVEGLELVCTPARHASGRFLDDYGRTLWSGWAILGERQRVYFSGDTGWFPELSEIGDRLGPFDVTMVEVGAYHRAWPDWHIGPEQAVLAHKALRGKLFLPIHWGLFNLALHGWTEPAERVLVAAAEAEVAITMPRPGQPVEPDNPPKLLPWWPKVPYETLQEHPIWSTMDGNGPVTGEPPVKQQR